LGIGYWGLDKEGGSSVRKRGHFLVLLAVGLGLTALAVNVFQGAPVAAGPLAAPTPISAPAGGQGEWIMVTYLSTNTVDVDVNCSGRQIAAYTTLDLQHIVDVTDAQTVTCYLDFSNDNSNWARGPTVINAGADETDLQQYNLFGRYSRITCTLDSTNEVTLTVKGKAFR
jgi:hypothetical protein